MQVIPHMRLQKPREFQANAVLRSDSARQELQREIGSPRQGVGLLERFAQDNRIRIRQPQRNLQKKLVRSLSNGGEFVAYVDAIGYLDDTRRLLEWKTTTARYAEHPEGLTTMTCNWSATRGSAGSRRWLLWPS